jgi:hypothetical protein
VSLTVGMFVLAGWLMDLEQLTNIVPGWPRMSMLAASRSCWRVSRCGSPRCEPFRGHHRRERAHGDRRADPGCARCLGWNAHLEQFTLARYRRTPPSPPPRRMAPATASAFVLLGLSLILRLRPRTALLHQGLDHRGNADRLAGPVALRVRRRSLFVFSDMRPAQRAAHPALCAVAL